MKLLKNEHKKRYPIPYPSSIDLVRERLPPVVRAGGGGFGVFLPITNYKLLSHRSNRWTAQQDRVLSIHDITDALDRLRSASNPNAFFRWPSHLSYSSEAYANSQQTMHSLLRPSFQWYIYIKISRVIPKIPITKHQRSLIPEQRWPIQQSKLRWSESLLLLRWSFRCMSTLEVNDRYFRFSEVLSPRRHFVWRLSSLRCRVQDHALTSSQPFLTRRSWSPIMGLSERQNR